MNPSEDHDIKALLARELASEAAPVAGGAETVIRRGRHIRRRAALASSLASVVLVGGLAGLIYVAASREPSRNTPAPAEQPPPAEHDFREASEKDEAEVFAFRAIAAAGLLDPDGSYFGLRQEIRRLEQGWRIGFLAGRCTAEPIDDACVLLSGEADTGRQPPDSFLVVQLGQGKWTVVEAEGNFPPDARDELLGFSLERKDEQPLWEFPTVKPIPAGQLAGGGYLASSLWVGPIPFDGPGSSCQLRAFDENGDAVHEATPFYADAPGPHPAELRSSITGSRGLPEGIGAVRLEIACLPFEGTGWTVVSEPIVADPEAPIPEDAVLVSVDLVWREQGLMNAESTCAIVLYDSQGDVVANRRSRVDATAVNAFDSSGALDQGEVAFAPEDESGGFSLTEGLIKGPPYEHEASFELRGLDDPWIVQSADVTCTPR